MEENDQVVFRYCDATGKAAAGNFPANPNGATADIAAICDRSGRIMGMMPHPERGLYLVNHPDYHHREEHAARAGEDVPELDENNFRIFTNAVAYAKQNGA